jgi:pimeloyl-ACP methyl ester carboxylesterase
VNANLGAGLLPFAVETASHTIQGWKIEPQRGADRIPALFVHPINLQGLAWAEVTQSIGIDRQCLLPDLRGHGHSSCQGPFGVDAWVDDLVAVLDHFEVSRCHVVGGSLGGTLGVALARRSAGRVVSIAAFGSTLAVEGDGLEAVLDVLRDKGVRGMFEEAIPALSVAPGTPRELISSILELTNPNDVATVSQVWRATISTDIRDLTRGLSVPALVATGELDLTCPVSFGEAMARCLGTTLVTLPGVGHLPIFEAPARTVSLLEEFFSRYDPAS